MFMALMPAVHFAARIIASARKSKSISVRQTKRPPKGRPSMIA